VVCLKNLLQFFKRNELFGIFLRFLASLQQHLGESISLSLVSCLQTFHLKKPLERGYVCDFYGGYFAFLVVVDYYFAVWCGFAFRLLCVAEPYEEVAYVFAVVDSYHSPRQLQPVFGFDFLQHTFNIDV
jgi:hypothetical protein